MLTLRSFLLTTSLGLLTSFAAAAQSAASGPTPTTVLSWVVWWAAGVVLLMAIITAGSVTSVAQHRLRAQPATLPAAPEAPTTGATEATATKPPVALQAAAPPEAAYA